MKIAISCSDATLRKEVFEKILEKYDCFQVPELNVGDDFMTNEAAKNLNFFAKRKDECLMNSLDSDIEKELLKQMIGVEANMRQYKSNKNLLLCGCTIDVMLETMYLASKGLVSESFVEKMMAKNKRFMEDIDLVYIVPNKTVRDAWKKRAQEKAEAEEKKEEYKEPELTDDEKEAEEFEMLYENFLQTFFRDSYGNSYLPEEGGAVETFISDNYIAEFADIVDVTGELVGEDKSPEVLEKFRRLFGGRTVSDMLKVMTSNNYIEFGSKPDEENTKVSLVEEGEA